MGSAETLNNLAVDGPHLNTVVYAGTGPYCLLVHGAVASRSYWYDNIDELSTVCRPVVVELWGHGNSPSPVDAGRYEPDAYVEEFEYLRQDLGADGWFTIGQSMGAALTLRYGLAHPERVLGQIITNSNSTFTEAAVWMQRNHDFVVPHAERVEAEGPGVLRDTWFNPSRSRRLSERLRERLAVEFDQHTAPGIAATLRITNATLPLGDRVMAITRPTLLTNGTLEPGFQKLLESVRRIPGLEEVEINGGHAVNGHDPDAWNRAVVGFIRRLTAGS